MAKSKKKKTSKPKVMKQRRGPFIFPGGPTVRVTTQGFPGQGSGGGPSGGGAGAGGGGGV